MTSSTRHAQYESVPLEFLLNAKFIDKVSMPMDAFVDNPHTQPQTARPPNEHIAACFALVPSPMEQFGFYKSMAATYSKQTHTQRVDKPFPVEHPQQLTSPPPKSKSTPTLPSPPPTAPETLRNESQARIIDAIYSYINTTKPFDEFIHHIVSNVDAIFKKHGLAKKKNMDAASTKERIASQVNLTSEDLEVISQLCGINVCVFTSNNTKPWLSIRDDHRVKDDNTTASTLFIEICASGRVTWTTVNNPTTHIVQILRSNSNNQTLDLKTLKVDELKTLHKVLHAKAAPSTAKKADLIAMLSQALEI